MTKINKMLVEGDLPEWRYLYEQSLWTQSGETINPPTSIPAWSANMYGTYPTRFETVKDLFSTAREYDPQRYYKKGYKDWVSIICQEQQKALLIAKWSELQKVYPSNASYLNFQNTTTDDESYNATLAAMNDSQHKVIITHFDDFDAISHELGSDSQKFRDYAIKFSWWLKGIVSNLRDNDIFAMGSDHGRDTKSCCCFAQANHSHKFILWGDVKKIITLFRKGPLQFPTNWNGYQFLEFKPSILTDVSITDVKSTMLALNNIKQTDGEKQNKKNKQGKAIKEVVDVFSKFNK